MNGFHLFNVGLEPRFHLPQVGLGRQVAVEVLRAVDDKSIQDSFHKMRNDKLPTYREMLRSRDAVEGVKAFVEKRNSDLKEQ